MEKRIIETTEADLESVYDLPENLGEFIKYLQSIHDNIPEEFKSKTNIEFDTIVSWDTPITSVRVYYKRPETDEEFISRKRANELNELRLRKLKLEQFINLKKELFGDTDEKFIDRV